MSLVPNVKPLTAKQARSESIGYLALLYTGHRLSLQVLHSASGHYIGTVDEEGPVSRESLQYFPSAEVAHDALATGRWQQALPKEPLARRFIVKPSIPQDVLDQITRENDHFAQAPEAFFQAWKRGVEIAGTEWFGDGTRDGLKRATTKWDLRPNVLMLSDALGVLSGNQRMFLAAMVSIYDAREGGAMLRRCGFEGFSDLDGLDLERRRVIADLVLHYHGW
ncbi:hypothetical protein BCh11DRAFT_05410 [Burkholderia sp. Ch1-1]|nr:hypothetical protein BCh11DRAFT_05410 [Burkholderia sp. Ch1-1]